MAGEREQRAHRQLAQVYWWHASWRICLHIFVAAVPSVRPNEFAHQTEGNIHDHSQGRPSDDTCVCSHTHHRCCTWSRHAADFWRQESFLWGVKEVKKCDFLILPFLPSLSHLCFQQQGAPARHQTASIRLSNSTKSQIRVSGVTPVSCVGVQIYQLIARSFIGQ